VFFSKDASENDDVFGSNCWVAISSAHCPNIGSQSCLHSVAPHRLAIYHRVEKCLHLVSLFCVTSSPLPPIVTVSIPSAATCFDSLRRSSTLIDRKSRSRYLGLPRPYQRLISFAYHIENIAAGPQRRAENPLLAATRIACSPLPDAFSRR